VAPLLIRAADRVCVLSADHAESVPYLRRAAARRPGKLVEMPNGVDTELFSPRTDASALRSRLGLPDGALLAAFVATLDRAHHFKRLDLAIDALALLGGRDGAASGLPPVHLVVAGGGELLDDFRARAEASGVADRAHFLGPVPHRDLPDVLRAADLFLLPTEPPESFGIVLIEAMACGLPVVATEYPGVRAVIDEGETGLLVPPDDATAIAAAIRRLSDAGVDGRRRMGAAGRAKCELRWSWPRLLDRMDDAYSEAIRARRGGGA
jgi:glycosyltransferase involved in cell wall biosynthesis